MVNKLLFGTAGTPHASKGNSLDGIITVNELGLDAMELEFVRGVRMKEDLALEIKKTAEQYNVHLTVHAPYYINLNSLEKPKIHASINRVLKACRIGSIAGATHVTFHPGFYMKMPSKKAYENVSDGLGKIEDKLKEEKIKIKVCLETTGKCSQIGSLEEIVSLSKEFKMIFPTVDFSHVHARCNGCLKSVEDFDAIIDLLKTGKFHKDLHMHCSGINYSDKGELNHLNLKESDMQYKGLLQSLKQNNITGILICESPNIEEDALMMKKYFSSL